MTNLPYQNGSGQWVVDLPDGTRLGPFADQASASASLSAALDGVALANYEASLNALEAELYAVQGRIKDKLSRLAMKKYTQWMTAYEADIQTQMAEGTLKEAPATTPAPTFAQLLPYFTPEELRGLRRAPSEFLTMCDDMQTVISLVPDALSLRLYSYLPLE